MALFEYQKQCQRLIQDAQQRIINPGDLVGYINEARVQLAGEAACLRVLATLPTVFDVRGPYDFSAVSLGSAVGIGGILNIRTVWYRSGAAQRWITPREFEWYSLYELNKASPGARSTPSLWSQYGQGVNGSIYIAPPPAAIYTLVLDAVCYPIDLVTNDTVEAIPRPWTSAIPYYAAYLAFLSDQVGDHTAVAEKMLKLYEMFVARGRRFSTPEVMPLQYSQVMPAQPEQGSRE